MELNIRRKLKQTKSGYSCDMTDIAPKLGKEISKPCELDKNASSKFPSMPVPQTSCSKSEAFTRVRTISSVDDSLINDDAFYAVDDYERHSQPNGKLLSDVSRVSRGDLASPRDSSGTLPSSPRVSRGSIMKEHEWRRSGSFSISQQVI